MLEEWIRGITGKDEAQPAFMQGKKGKYLLVILICLGLLALIWPATRVQPRVSDVGTGNTGTAARPADNIKAQLSGELAAILSQVEGAGKVEVSLTLASDGLKTFATNSRDETRETQETDRQGINKKVHEQNVVRDLAVSGGQALLIEQKSPQVVGVLVVADGAENPLIREQLTDAAATLLNVSPHQVRVVTRSTEPGKE